MKINCTAAVTSDCACDSCFNVEAAEIANVVPSNDSVPPVSVPVRIARGSFVEVYKGRKVPKGTKGVVFYYNENGKYGPSLGLKDSLGAVHWSAVSNCRAVEMPAEVKASVDNEKAAYVAFQAAQREEHEARPADKKPIKGLTVQIISGRNSGLIGKCFWMSPDGDRIGIKDAYGTAHWVKVWEAENVGPWTQNARP